MSRGRSEEAASRLDRLENELRTALLRELPSTEADGRSLFTNSEFNPHELGSAHLLPTAEHFLELAHETLTLRERLGIEPSAGPGYLYLQACRENANLGDPHRRGPR